MGMHAVNQDEGKIVHRYSATRFIALATMLRTARPYILAWRYHAYLPRCPRKVHMQHDRNSHKHAPICHVIAKRRIGRSVQARREGNQMTDSLIGSRHICAFHTRPIWVHEEVDPAADTATHPKITRGIIREVTSDRRPLPITVTLCT
jgi:hypothetical protein